MTRWIGVKETSNTVQNTVLKQGQTFKGILSIQNRQYLAVFTPLKDINNNIIGMIFIGQPQVAILEAAGRSVELTFVVTALLLIVSIIPAYLISKYLARQLD
jgi:methyl-accepting chemotaxis protein